MVGKPQVDYPRRLLRERSLGVFQRSFTFPDEVNADGMKATLKDGLLRIVVPKTLTDKPGTEKMIHVE
jgi:HSP20 family molecular chaperone IbpA